MKNKIFNLVFEKEWHIEYLGRKYKIISEPKVVKEGYKYIIEEYKGE